MKKEKPIIWDYFHPAYQKELLSRPHWKTTEPLFGGIMPKTDLTTLFRDGGIYGIFLNKGRLKFFVDFEGLLASGNHELLKKPLRWKHTEPRAQQLPSIHEVLAPYIISGDKSRSLLKVKEFYEKTRPQNRKVDFPAWLIIFLAVTLDSKELAMEYLAEEEKANINFRYCLLPRCRMLLFQDDHKARALLESEVSQARSVIDLVYCARAWKHLFNDDNEAEICLRNAKTSPEYVSGWADYATACKQIFNNDEETLSVIRAHEETAKNAHEYFACAHLWMKLFGDKNSANRCIVQMDTAAKSFCGAPNNVFSMRHFTAHAWITVLGNKKKAREWALEAEKAISEMEPYSRVGAWDDLSQFYNNELNDSAEHARCYKIYENECDTVFD